MKGCIFCAIVAGQAPAKVIWEDDKHMAFLSIFPNTPGNTVVITKTHYASYAFDLPDNVLAGLLHATKRVAKLLDRSFDDVGRTGMVFEGFGVDHIHAKLYPLHGTGDMAKWKPIESGKMKKFFPQYPGYISSNDGPPADNQELSELADLIRSKDVQ